MKNKLRIFTVILLVLISLNTVVLGLTSYDQYYNSDYSYSLRIPHESSSKVVETNRAAVIIPFTNQNRLQINVDDVSNLLTSDEKEGVNTKKLTLKSQVFEKTYGNLSYIKKNANDIVSDFETAPKVTSVEEVVIDHMKAFEIFYDTELTKSDGKTAKGHGLLIFTVTNGHVFNFIFTDNKLAEKNITDYEYVQKAIQTIDLEDVDYKPFILIGVFCVVLYLLLMSLYLKAERMASLRKERRRKEKELSKRREEGFELVGQDDDFEYYDQILLDEAGSDDTGDDIYTVEQIMEMYPSLKKVTIRPKGSGDAVVTENKNVIDYKAIDEEKEKKEKAEKNDNPWAERIDEDEAPSGFVFEDVSDEISDETRKSREELDLSFDSKVKTDAEFTTRDYGRDDQNESEEGDKVDYSFEDDHTIYVHSEDENPEEIEINNNELYEEMKKSAKETENGDK